LNFEFKTDLVQQQAEVQISNFQFILSTSLRKERQAGVASLREKKCTTRIAIAIRVSDGILGQKVGPFVCFDKAFQDGKV